MISKIEELFNLTISSALFILTVGHRQAGEETSLPTLHFSIWTLQSWVLETSLDIQLLFRHHMQAVYEEVVYESHTRVEFSLPNYPRSLSGLKVRQ